MLFVIFTPLSRVPAFHPPGDPPVPGRRECHDISLGAADLRRVRLYHHLRPLDDAHVCRDPTGRPIVAVPSLAAIPGTALGAKFLASFFQIPPAPHSARVQVSAFIISFEGWVVRRPRRETHQFVVTLFILLNAQPKRSRVYSFLMDTQISER